MAQRSRKNRKGQNVPFWQCKKRVTEFGVRYEVPIDSSHTMIGLEKDAQIFDLATFLRLFIGILKHGKDVE